MLAISSLSTEDKKLCHEACRRVLPNIKASSTPPYRILLEAVGLPIPSGHMGSNGLSGAPRQTSNSSPGWQHQSAQVGLAQQRGPQVPQGVPGAYGYYPYHQPNVSPALSGLTPGNLGAYGPMGQNLSPLLVAQNMPLGQTRNPSPKVGGMSPHTPIARHRGRMSPNSQMLSPGSDPFNPVSTVS